MSSYVKYACLTKIHKWSQFWGVKPLCPCYFTFIFMQLEGWPVSYTVPISYTGLWLHCIIRMWGFAGERSLLPLYLFKVKTLTGMHSIFCSLFLKLKMTGINLRSAHTYIQAHMHRVKSTTCTYFQLRLALLANSFLTLNILFCTDIEVSNIIADPSQTLKMWAPSHLVFRNLKTPCLIVLCEVEASLCSRSPQHRAFRFK